MGAIDEIASQVLASLNAYDFSLAFPSGYAGQKNVILTDAFPYDLIDNMQASSDGQMTRPVISVVTVDTRNSHRTLGNVTNIGAPAGHTRFATRIEAYFMVGCWADVLLGGADTVKKLGGLVIGWGFQNQMSLAAYRQLNVRMSREAYEDRPQLWAVELELSGYATLSYDV